MLFRLGSVKSITVYHTSAAASNHISTSSGTRPLLTWFFQNRKTTRKENLYFFAETGENQTMNLMQFCTLKASGYLLLGMTVQIYCQKLNPVIMMKLSTELMQPLVQSSNIHQHNKRWEEF